MKKIFALLTIAVIFMSACQPTPEKEVVVPRDNTEKMVIEAAKNEQEAAGESAEPPAFQYGTPEHISERYTVFEDILDVVIEADVIMPEIQSVPVAKVKSSPFTQERADELRQYFMKDGKLVSQYVRTKDDYDEMIIQARLGHEVDGEMVFDENDEQWIKQLLEEREKAPEKDVANLITDYSISSEDGYSGRLIINGEEKGSLHGTKTSFGYSDPGFFRTTSHNSYDEEGNLLEYPTVEIGMSREEAVQAAQEVFSDLNISGMAIKEIYEAYYYEDNEEYDYFKVPDFGGYYMTFMREFGGMMPVKFNGFSIGRNDNYDVSPPVDAEILTIAIDEYGNIRTFNWRYPVEIVGVLTEHVEILPFEDIMERFYEFSEMKWAHYSERTGSPQMVNKVVNIGFSLMYLPIKNNTVEFMYVPCWIYEYKPLIEYTDEENAYREQMGAVVIHEDEMGSDYIIFSAVDGASVSAYSSEAFERVQRMREEHEGG